MNKAPINPCPPGTDFVANRIAEAQGVAKSGAILAHIRKTITPEMISRALTEAMQESYTYTKEGGQQPDHKTRMEAARLILSYTEGTPIQRVETKTQVVETDDQALGRMLASPAARARLKAMIESVDRAANIVDEAPKLAENSPK